VRNIKLAVWAMGCSIICLGLGAVAALHNGGTASAQAPSNVAAVYCGPAAPGNAECTVELFANISTGGTLSIALPAGESKELTCDALQGGTTCGATATSATITCAAGCVAGGEFNIGVLGTSTQDPAGDFTITSTGTLSPAIGQVIPIPAWTPGSESGS
jgi:hypothetical protein